MKTDHIETVVEKHASVASGSSGAPSHGEVEETSAVPVQLERSITPHSVEANAGPLPVDAALAPALENMVRTIVATDPFGASAGASGEVHYRTLNWWQCSLLMMAETISLGILSLPATISKMGFVPGTLLIAGFGIIATYTGYVIGQFRREYPGIHSFADAGLLIGGRVGEWIMAIMQALVFILIMAAHLLTFTIMMNVLTRHALCTMVFAGIGLVVSLAMTLPRTLKNVSMLSLFSCLSIGCAVIIAMIAVGVSKPDMTSALAIVDNDSYTSTKAYALGISNIVIAFTGHTAYFGFISELRNPQDFGKSLALLQTMCVSFYIVVAVVIYRYAGAGVASPALGSAPPLIQKIAYGIASPTIVVAGVVNAHVCVKNIYVRAFRGTTFVRQRNWRSRGCWYALCTVAWVAAFLAACGIPVFMELLGVLGALLCSWFSMGVPAVFWLYMNKGVWFWNWRKTSLTVLNMSIVVACFFVCIFGTWASVTEIADGTNGARPFSCDDNSIM